MKKTNKKYLRNKFILWGGLFLVAAGVAVAVFLNYNNIFKPKADEKKVETAQNEAQESAKPEKETEAQKPSQVGKQNSDPNRVEGKTPVQYETNGHAQSDDKISGFVNFMNIVDGKLVINAVLDNMLKSPGQCTLNMVSDGGLKIKELKVTTGNDPKNSHCESFEVLKDSLGRGKWKINVKVEADNKIGFIEDEVEL